MKSGRVPSARDSVFELLRRRIIKGELPAGVPLNASRLALTVESSRTPVREALLRLLAEGLIVETPAGLVVKQLSEQEIMELYEVRVPLETLAARLAAEHLTPLHLAHIEAINEKFAAGAQQGDPDADWLAAVNLDLHRAICEASQNQFLIEFMSKIYDSVGRFRNTTYRRAGRIREAVIEHQELAAAIAARDPERASEIAQKHMWRAREARLAMFRDAHRHSG